MKGDALRTNVLSVRIIPNADPHLRKELKLPEGYRSLGIITTDCDDVSYAALDEATKKAKVTVVYAKSMYAGSANANTALAGEFIGILAGEDPADVRSGLDAALKRAEVTMNVYYGPPTETNFAGGLLTGDQAACRAACEAFAETVINIAEDPLSY